MWVHQFMLWKKLSRIDVKMIIILLAGSFDVRPEPMSERRENIFEDTLDFDITMKGNLVKVILV